MRKKTNEEFITELAKKNNVVIPIDKYINMKEKIKVRCSFCGHIWSAQPSNLLNGNRCPKCFGTPKKTNEQFEKDLKKLNPLIIPIEKYIDAKTPIKVRCSICGHEWNSSPNNVLGGKRCPKCFGTPKKTNEQFEKEFNYINKDIYLLSEYKTTKDKIKVKCKKCGYEWEMSPNDAIRKDGKNTGCPKCAGNIQKTNKEFVSELKAINPTIIPIEKYINNRIKILCKCKKCSYEWKAQPHRLLSGQGCPNCALGFQTSYFEQCIKIMFEKILGEKSVINRNKDFIGKELDIYIPSLKIAIEPGSWFWHKSKIKKDQEKFMLCKEKGVKLLTIYDDVDSDINKIDFHGDLLIIREDMGLNKKDLNLLKKYLEYILAYCGIKYIISNELLTEIREKAEYSTRKKNTDDFYEELKLNNNKVIPLGEYINSRNKIKVKCKKCGYEWEAVPTNLIKGHGCPKCNNVYKKTTSDFIQELKLKNNTLEVLGEYIGARENIKTKCNVCGHIWNAHASNLLRGHGCPKCAINKRKKQTLKF